MKCLILSLLSICLSLPATASIGSLSSSRSSIERVLRMVDGLVSSDQALIPEVNLLVLRERVLQISNPDDLGSPREIILKALQSLGASPPEADHLTDSIITESQRLQFAGKSGVGSDG